MLFIVLFSLCFPVTALSTAIGEDASKQCQSCHETEHSSWLKSDHAKAMAVANKQTVLGDFSQTLVSHYGQKALFFIQNDQHMVSITYGDVTDTYPIKHTFGHYPLQQYLVETSPGRIQVLPFAWDARAKDKGGQRWFHNYSDEEIVPQDRLHWRQPLQNWNGMCADCHSDGLKRNYNEQTNTFNTTWKGINVSCISCHGDMPKHSINTNKPGQVLVKKVSVVEKTQSGHWLRNSNDKTAHWKGSKRDNSFMDTCFACHSLRAPLTDGMKPKTAMLDLFMPQLLNAPMYHVDGQIKEEVYVYGSFQQSKMFAAGVNCLDCHDKHTMKIKIPGNGLCLQCHASDVYDVKKHHQHKEGLRGSQCVDCHMSENRYMGVDDRRDHSFKIPRPDISNIFCTPNACVSCHKDKSDEWAEKTLTVWHGKPDAISPTRHNYYRLHRGERISLVQHLAIIADVQIDVITRATAISLLSYSTNRIDDVDLVPYLTHSEQLLRLAAAGAAVLLPIDQRVKFVAPLLNDKYKAIRVAAAKSLVDIGIASQKLPLFKKAFQELYLTNQISSWRGEGRLNQASVEFSSGQFSAAELSFKAVIDVEPYFEAGYVNLAEFYRSQQRVAQVQSVLTLGMEKLPESASLSYVFALSLVRQQQHHKATYFFERAMFLQPNEQQYAYAYILSLDGQNETSIAVEKLQNLMANYPKSQRLKELGLYLAQKDKNQSAYNWFNDLSR